MADVARAERLRALRAETHLSRERAAGEIGVTTKTLYEWERGGHIRWENAKKVAEFYGVEPESIVDRESGEEFTVVDTSRLDRIEEKVDEILEEIRREVTEDDETDDDRGIPSSLPPDPDRPPDVRVDDAREKTD